MSTNAYHIQIQQLTLDEQFQLMEDLLAIIRRRVSQGSLHSILELEGLGEEIWVGVDVREYINQERDSW